jgi:Pin2-interacting protein X1
VSLKDDTLGLGARTGRADRDETFGLELLSGLLGRLNGKEETVLKKEKAVRRDVKLMSYHEKRWGASRFVFGGYLVGDDIQEDLESVVEEQAVDQKKIQKKRKRLEEETLTIEVLPVEQVIAVTDNVEIEKDSLQQPDKREEKKRRKEEKRARKEARRLRREQRKAAADESSTSSASEQDIGQAAQEKNENSSASQPKTSGTSTPSSTPRGRQAIRGRYIQQKRMALLDEKALNEVCFCPSMMIYRTDSLQILMIKKK